ncbi:MAG: hypothetical protein EA397_05875 [Deltaproteobacteria bacterium]|nr:MAG: hypothetical protein EA397_05875 [Deltaproteobacteria bacterium]
MAERLLVSLGVSARPGGLLRAELRLLDLGSGAWSPVWSMSPVSLAIQGDHAGVTALVGEELWVPTRRAIVVLDPCTFRVIRHIDHPLFHDLHSVTDLGAGEVLVTSTGNELLLTLTTEGDLRDVMTLGEPRDLDRDYRGLPYDEFKPHRVHPNHVTLWQGRRLVTGLRSATCTDLDDRSYQISFGGRMPHDGRLREGSLWFTTTCGSLVQIEPSRRTVVLDLRIVDLSGGEKLLGFCRGIEIEEDRIWVGLSRVRWSRWRSVAGDAWRALAGRPTPARVVEIDLSRRCVVRTFDLPDAGGADIYGLTRW